MTEEYTMNSEDMTPIDLIVSCVETVNRNKLFLLIKLERGGVQPEAHGPHVAG